MVLYVENPYKFGCQNREMPKKKILISSEAYGWFYLHKEFAQFFGRNEHGCIWVKGFPCFDEIFNRLFYDEVFLVEIPVTVLTF